MRILQNLPRASRRGGAFVALAIAAASVAVRAEDPKDKPKAAPVAKVSYDKQVRPIFQAHCQGCHQPAKAGGGYVMTGVRPAARRAASRRPRRSSPGKPDESHLIEQITPARTARPRCPRTSRR